MKHIKCYDLLLEPINTGYDSISNFKLEGPESLVDLVNEVFKLRRSNREKSIVAGFNASGYLTGLHQVSSGHVTSTSVSPDQLFKFLLLTNSTSFILLHNHPSGSDRPSKDDEFATARIIQCGRLMNIQMLDHIIVTNKAFTSLKRETAVFDVT